MKYLKLLFSVFRSWFKRNRKFTVSVMLMFSLSAFVMLFTATVIGNIFLWTYEEEVWASKTYSFYTENNFYDINRIILSDTILDALYSSESNSIDRIEADITIKADKIKDTENVPIAVMPILKREYSDKIWCLMRTGVTGKADFYHIEQNIKEGREIKQEDIEENKNVIVMPENYGVEIGENVILFGKEFLVVGITTDEYARLGSFFMEKNALTDEDSQYVIRNIEFNKPMTDETYTLLNEAVKKAMGKEIINYRQPQLSDEPKTVYTIFMLILGVVVAIFTVCGIYYPTLQLCKETIPMLSVLKLCGMRTIPSFGLLFISVFVCLAASFGFSSLMLILSESFFTKYLSAFELRGLYFVISAVVFALVTVIAMLPPLIKMAKMQPAEEVII